MKRLLFCLLLTGCAGGTIVVPDSTARKTAHTHKVFFGSDYLTYQDENGFGCGHIENMGNGVYSAEVVNWDDPRKGPVAQADYNKFEDAEILVERYCKP